MNHTLTQKPSRVRRHNSLCISCPSSVPVKHSVANTKLFLNIPPIKLYLLPLALSCSTTSCLFNRLTVLGVRLATTLWFILILPYTNLTFIHFQRLLYNCFLLKYSLNDILTCSLGQRRSFRVRWMVRWYSCWLTENTFATDF